MKLWRKMSKIEHNNWRKGAILGFYTFLILLFTNYIYFFLSGSEPLSSFVIFWSGLIVAFGYELLLNLRSKLKSEKKE